MHTAAARTIADPLRCDSVSNQLIVYFSLRSELGLLNILGVAV